MKMNVYLIESISDFEEVDDRCHVFADSFGDAADRWFQQFLEDEFDITKITLIVRGVQVPVIDFLSVAVPNSVMDVVKKDEEIAVRELVYWDKDSQRATLVCDGNLSIGRCDTYASRSDKTVRVRMGIS